MEHGLICLNFDRTLITKQLNVCTSCTHRWILHGHHVKNTKKGYKCYMNSIDKRRFLHRCLKAINV